MATVKEGASFYVSHIFQHTVQEAAKVRKSQESFETKESRGVMKYPNKEQLLARTGGLEPQTSGVPVIKVSKSIKRDQVYINTSRDSSSPSAFYQLSQRLTGGKNKDA